MLKAGILGLGVGERHIQGYTEHPNCIVTRICDCNAEKLLEVSERHPGIATTTHTLDVLDDPDIDVVSIATWDNVHTEQIVRAIKNGKHVFAEKPLCLHEGELQKIRRALTEHPSVRLSCNFVLRVNPRFCDLYTEVKKGTFGQLYYLEADYNYGRIHKIIDGWRGQIPYYSVFLGGAVHLVDLLTWMTGWKVTEVTARGNNLATKDTDFKFNDLTVALLTFENGAIAKVAANFACVTPHFHRMTLYGTEATFEHHPEHGKIIHSRDSSASPALIESPYYGTQKTMLLSAFIDSILGINAPNKCVATHDELFATMSVCLAVEKSLREGKIIPVQYY